MHSRQVRGFLADFLPGSVYFRTAPTLQHPKLKSIEDGVQPAVGFPIPKYILIPS